MNASSRNTLSQLYGKDLSRFFNVNEMVKNDIRVCIPAEIVSINYNEMTCSCQPLIMEKIKDEQGIKVDVKLPLLLDVPLVFPGSRDFCITFPISVGDEVLVFFSDMCIDSWWQSGNVQAQFEERRHDLSDGFAIPSQMSQLKKLTNVSETKLEIKHRGTGGKIEVTNDKVLIDGINVHQLKSDFDALLTAFNALVNNYNSHTHSGYVGYVTSGTDSVPFSTGTPD